MPAGIRVWNADGSLQFDTTYRLFRAVLSFTTSAGNGSQTFPGISAAGLLVPLITGRINYAAPIISISGDTVSWSFDGSSVNSPAVATSVLLLSR